MASGAVNIEFAVRFGQQTQPPTVAGQQGQLVHADGECAHSQSNRKKHVDNAIDDGGGR